MVKRACLILFPILFGCLWAQPRQTENVILVTLDGVRWQEVFRGADCTLLDPDKHQNLLSHFCPQDAGKRRETLLPFFWKELIPQGIVFGNRDLGSTVDVTNPHKFSYPGYSEILLGKVFPEIDSNSDRHYPYETVLEFVRRRLRLDYTDVAVFASWQTFNFICTQKPGTVMVNAGNLALESAVLTPAMESLNALQFETMTPWDSVRHDALTARMALTYLKEYQPRLLYIALDETDDWAHDGRYDRVLQSLHHTDDFLRLLWNFVQESDGYRDTTTLIISTDHGRGRSAEDWTDHGDVPGAEETWIAIIGPDTPKLGEARSVPPAFQQSIAATILRLMNLDYQEFRKDAGIPIAAALLQ